MSVKLRIKITKDILKRSASCAAHPHSIPQNCAVALAVREIFPNASVGTSSMITGYINGPCIMLPHKVVEFIKKFDSLCPFNRTNMDEFEFEIDIPDSIINRLPLPNIQELIKDSKTLELCY